jgi:hypothetical protein
MRQVFPRGSDHLAVDRSKLPDGHPNTLDRRIVDLAEQGETIDAIALHLHATPFAFYQRLFALSHLGVVSPVEAVEEDEPLDVEVEVVDPETIPEVLGEVADPEAMAEQVRAFLKTGHFFEAEELARTAAGQDPSSTTLQALLREAETGLLAELRAGLLETPLAPKLVKDPKALGTRLSAAERYLLKRFDGTKTLRQVIRVSPIRELDALKLVRRFIDAGVVVLEDPA